MTTIGIKIYENLMNIGVNLDGFILKTENEQGPSENIDILREYKKRQASAQYYQAHRDEIKQQKAQYRLAKKKNMSQNNQTPQANMSQNLQIIQDNIRHNEIEGKDNENK